jgi:uncharacterized protein (TIGR03118 family)
MRNYPLWVGLTTLLALPGLAPTAAKADAFTQTNLVSDIQGLAPNFDPNLKNPWGVSFSPGSSGSPFWVSDQVSGKATLYNSTGTPLALVVNIPVQSGNPPTGPTGQVFNTTGDFKLLNGTKASFIFANLEGTISAWNGGTNAEIKVLPTVSTTYTGLALASVGGSSFLFAADSRNGKVDVFDGTFTKTSLAGSFTDPNLPSGFTPYNVQVIGNTVYVTYENRASGGGVVNAFHLDGTFDHRIAANANGGILDSPWGLAIAPAGFGSLGGDLLVGNEENGHISAFNTTTGAFIEQLTDSKGNPIVNTGLWALNFGNGGNGGNPNTLYFAAGINGEKDGLFGAITAVPEPGPLALAGVGGFLAAALGLRKAKAKARQR